MSLVAFDGTPLVAIGMAGREGTSYLPSANNITVDATNEACIMIGQIFTEDGSSHTIDTTGSSSLGWRASTVTFANAGTTVKVGLAAVDTANGPVGRAVNVADVITFDVSKSLTGGGGGITTNAWQEHAPSAGTKTIQNGDTVAFCIQATARAGVDSVLVSCGTFIGSATFPAASQFTGAAYSSAGSPNAVITFSDGKLGFFYGCPVFSTPSTNQTWNNTSGTVEYGNFLQMPVPASIYGIIANINVGGDVDLILYSDPLGTPVSQKSYSLDSNLVNSLGINRLTIALFTSPYSSTANQPLAAIMKPTTASNIVSPYLTFNSSSHQKSLSLGTNGYAVNRVSGAFAAQNSSKDRFSIGLLVGGFDAGGGSSAAVQYRANMSGNV